MEDLEKIIVVDPTGEHPLLKEALTWFEEGNPIGGWLMTLNDEELKRFVDSGMSQGEDPLVCALAIVIICGTEGYIPNETTLQVSKIHDQVYKLCVNLDLERLRRLGYMEIVDTSLKDEEWVWRHTQKGIEYAESLLQNPEDLQD